MREPKASTSQCDVQMEMQNGSHQQTHESVKRNRTISESKGSTFSRQASAEKLKKDEEIRIFTSRMPPKIGSKGILKQKASKYARDLFGTLLEMDWRYMLPTFLVITSFMWTFFSAYYWVVMFIHNDHKRNENSTNTPCLQNVQTFRASFIFSLETMTTIGCGYFYVTDECPQAYIGVIIQSILGTVITAGSASILISKVKIFDSGTETINVSKNACICVEDFKLKLMVRIANFGKGCIIGANIRGFLMRRNTKDELPDKSELINFTNENGQNNILLLYPETVTHVIDETSPLWKLTEEELLNAEFELVVVFVAVAEATGTNLQMTFSYMPNDILWGQRFKPLYAEPDSRGHFLIDVYNFEETYYTPTPFNYSAQSIHKFLNSELVLNAKLLENRLM